MNHYMQWRRTGSVETRSLRGKSNEERFWHYVDKSSGCWIWTGGKSHGYGTFAARDETGSERQVVAHRYAYTLLVGPIPAGLVLDHLCRQKACVRPQHLQPVRQQINVLRGDVARALRTNRCKHGHEYTPENTYVSKVGSRICRVCQRRNGADFRARRRAARAALSPPSAR